MLQIVYTPEGEYQIDKFMTIKQYDELLEVIRYKNIKLLSVPINGDTLDIIETIVSEKLDVETIHLQQTGDLLNRLKIFFYAAKRYSEEEMKKDVILKHEYLDNIIEKIKKD